MSDLMHKRILLKLSGEAMLGSRTYGIDPKVTDFIASEIAEVAKLGIEIVVIVGGGNIFRGLSAAEHGLNRATGDYIGMLATVMNSLALGSSLTKIGVNTRVQSSLEMPKVCETYIRNRALRHLEKGRVVIVGAGSGNPYFSTDTAAAIRACELDCEIVLKATKVDGIYEMDPIKNPQAKKYDNISYLEMLNKKIEVMDNTAVTLCMDNNLPMRVFKLLERGNLKKLLLGENIGTLIFNKNN